jgi:uncharacterized coiled-coil protein SlyX
MPTDDADNLSDRLQRLEEALMHSDHQNAALQQHVLALLQSLQRTEARLARLEQRLASMNQPAPPQPPQPTDETPND